MKYIAYCRKSTDESDRQVLSIESQISELKDFASRQNLEILDFVTESRTAKSPGRPLFKGVLERVESGEAQGIISWHPDRLARNSIDGGKIIYLLDTEKLVDLKFPSFWFENSPQGKFVLNMAFGQSKYYVDNLSENVKRGMKTLLKKGVMPARARKGYVYNKTLCLHEIDPIKSKVIKKAFEKYAKGVSQTDISKFLHLNGIKKRGGGELTLTSVERILKDKFYIGLFYFKGELYQGTHKTFISKSLFDRVQKQLETKTRKFSSKRKIPFRGLVKCGECGASITSEYHKKFFKRTKRLGEYYYYRCTKKLGYCSQGYITQDELEKQFRKVFLDAAIPTAWIPKWLKLLDTYEVIERQNKEKNIRQLEAKLKTIEEKLNLLLDSYLEGVVDSETYKFKKNELIESKLKLEEEKQEISLNGSGWLERMRKFINISKTGAKIARAKNNCEELAFFTKNIGSNFFLTNRHLSAKYKKGFDTVFFELSRLSRNQARLTQSHCERDREVESLSPPWEGGVKPFN